MNSKEIINQRENLQIRVTKMEAQNQKEVQTDNKIEDNLNIEDQAHDANDGDREKDVLPISHEQVHCEQTQVIEPSQDKKSDSQENEQICHKLQEANIDSPLLKKPQQDLSFKVVFQFSPNQPQREYMESIKQIQKILNDKDLSKVKFIQKILKDFSPYVFTNNQNKNNKKQKEPFDSEASFDSQGQQKVAKKIQYNTEKQKEFPMVLIDEDFFGTQWLQTIRENETLSSMFKYNAIFHCRIVFVLYVLTSNKYSFEKAYNIKLSQGLQKLKQKLQQNKIRYSFDKNLWTTQRESNLKKNQKNDKQNDKIPFVIQQMFRDKLFSKIDEFYTKIGFKNANHPFNKKMTILKEQTYRLRYIKEFFYYSFSNVEEIFKYLKTQKSQRFKNIEFYSNRVYATSRRLNLSKIHNDKEIDYEWLQRSHDYIQWLFPNHFRSQFNGSSYPLGYIQAEIFKNDPKLRKLLVRSFEIFIDFMGCSIKQNVEKIKETKTISIEANSDKKSRERLKNCLIYNTHNHLRIMRILACMSVTGLRTYAEALLKFLNGLKHNPSINFQYIKTSLQRNWNVYSFTPQNKQKALQMCFIPYTDFSYIEIEESKDWKSKQNFKQKMQIQDDHGKKKLKLNVNEK